MAVIVRNKKGKDVTLLNPAEKAGKFAYELKQGYRMTNDGKYKADKNGTVLGLNASQASYRMGYLQARKDSAKCYNAKKRKR